MTTTTFGTHAFIKRLTEAGFTESQAEALATELAKAQEAGIAERVTKSYLDARLQRGQGRHHQVGSGAALGAGRIGGSAGEVALI
jgi:hypothetical protein